MDSASSANGLRPLPCSWWIGVSARFGSSIADGTGRS